MVGAGTFAQQVLLSEMPRELWQTVTEQDVNGFFNVMRATLPRLKEWGGDHCALRFRWAPELAGARRHPVALKAAIEALITGIAREEGRHKIRANTVLLGVIEAGCSGAHQAGCVDEAWVKEVHKNLALWRRGKPEEVGHAVVFLASDRALYVTGQRIAVAGGYGL